MFWSSLWPTGRKPPSLQEAGGCGEWMAVVGKGEIGIPVKCQNDVNSFQEDEIRNTIREAIKGVD